MTRIVGLLLAAALLGLGIPFAWAHVSIRGLRPALPEVAAVLAAGRAAQDLPTRVSVLNSARQAMPRAAVIEPSLDPRPDEPYVMAFPAFLLEWGDGRGLLIDAGMDRETALSFGRPQELLAGAAALEVLPSVAEQLGPDSARPLALVFTHLHHDHTQGSVALCSQRRPDAPRVPLYQGVAQATRGNYTTWLGRRPLAKAPCLEPRRLADRSLAAIPGYPGVFVIRAAGHTPGSQVVVAFVRKKAGIVGYAFAGDAVNQLDGVREDLPKPRLYSLLVVPESDTRLSQVRRFLRLLEDRGDLRIVSSHDLRGIEALGLQPFRPQAAAFAPAEGA